MIVYRLLNNYLLMSVYAGHHASSYPSQCTDSYSITHVHNSTGSSLSPGGESYYIVAFPPGDRLLYSRFSVEKSYYGGKTTIQHRHKS